MRASMTQNSPTGKDPGNQIVTGDPASLNFRSCYSYALTPETREPILCKSDDFMHTGIRPA